MKRIVYMLSGALAVVIPVINDGEEITEQEALDRAFARIPQDATDVTLLEPSALPASREFRGAWVFNGNKTAVIVDEALAAAQSVPQEVTRRQAKQALALAGLLANVQPAIDAIKNPTQRALMQIEWDDSQVFQRNRPALLGLAAALGLNSTQLDSLFIQAATL